MYRYDRTDLIESLTIRCQELVNELETHEQDMTRVIWALSLAHEFLDRQSKLKLSEALTTSGGIVNSPYFSFACWRLTGVTREIAIHTEDISALDSLLCFLASGVAPDTSLINDLFLPLDTRETSITSEVLTGAVVFLDSGAQETDILKPVLDAYMDKFEIFGRLRVSYEYGTSRPEIPFDDADNYALLAVALLRLCEFSEDLRYLNCAMKLNDLIDYLCSLNLLPMSAAPIALRAVLMERSYVGRLHGSS